MTPGTRALAKKATGTMRALVTILLCYVLVISPALSELGKLGSSHSGAFAKLADETR